MQRVISVAPASGMRRAAGSSLSTSSSLARRGGAFLHRKCVGLSPSFSRSGACFGRIAARSAS